MTEALVERTSVRSLLCVTKANASERPNSKGENVGNATIAWCSALERRWRVGIKSKRKSLRNAIRRLAEG